MNLLTTSLCGSCLIAALILHLILEHALVAHATPSNRDPVLSLAKFISVLILPLWILITVPLLLGVAYGMFDWLSDRRALQYLLVLPGLILGGVMTWFSIRLMEESPTRIPRLLRPFVPFALHIFPPVLLSFAAVHLLAPTGASLLHTTLRAGVVLLAIVSGIPLALLAMQKAFHARAGAPAAGRFASGGRMSRLKS